MTTLTQTPALSIQAKLDQIEAGLAECHSLILDMTGPEDSSLEPGVAGAEAAGARCIVAVEDLRQRLSELRDRIGTL